MQHPSAVTHLLLALDFAIGPSFEVVIAGSLKQAETRSLLKKLRTRFLPNKVVLLRKPDEEAKELSGIAPFIEHMALIDGRPAAYVCSNFACSSSAVSLGKCRIAVQIFCFFLVAQLFPGKRVEHCL